MNPPNEFDPTRPQPQVTNAPAPAAAPVNVAPQAAQAQPAARPMTDQEVRDYVFRDCPEVSPGGRQLSPTALATKRKLILQPRMRTYVPFAQGEQKGAYRPVIINDLRLEVPKGKPVELPKSVAEILERAMGLEVSVLQDNEHNLANADAEKRKALGL